MREYRNRTCLLILTLTSCLGVFLADAFAADKESRRPKQYATIFLMGYGGDHFPQDDAGFERVVESVKKAHFNVILGLFQDDQGEDALVLANHNAYEAQPMELKLARAVKGVRLFDRHDGTWRVLSIKGGKVAFEVAPAACELLRVVR